MWKYKMSHGIHSFLEILIKFLLGISDMSVYIHVSETKFSFFFLIQNLFISIFCHILGTPCLRIKPMCWGKDKDINHLASTLTFSWSVQFLKAFACFCEHLEKMYKIVLHCLTFYVVLFKIGPMKNKWIFCYQEQN